MHYILYLFQKIGQIGIEIIDMFLSVHIFCYVVTVVDYFSKYLPKITWCGGQFLVKLMSCYGSPDILITG